MKKIYSIVLMAAALLIGTNVKAETLTAGTADALVTAFENAQDGDVIQLTADIVIPNVTGAYYTTPTDVETGLVYNKINKSSNVPYITIDRAGQELTLDLAGKNITSGEARPYMFWLKAGVLNVINTSSTEAKIQSNHIEESIDKKYILDPDGKKIPIPGQSKKYQANGVVVPSSGYPIVVTGCDDPYLTDWYSHLNIGSNVTIQGNATGAYIYVNPTNTKIPAINGFGAAMGARIDVNNGAKVIGGKYGAQITGMIKFVPDADATPKQTEEFIPVIYIHDGAESTTINREAIYAVGAYSAGYGHFIIEGEVHSATGVYAKSGEVDIQGKANVYSDASTYTTANGQASGVGAAGSAIVLESNKSYNGEINVTVSENATITGKSGYAVESTITTANNNKVEGITIEGGNFNKGEKGCMDVAPVIADDASKITIDGGNFSSSDEIQTILAAISSATGDDFVLGQVEKDGKTIIVIETLPMGESVDKTNVSINALSGQEYVDWDNHQETLSADGVKLEKLQLFNGSQLIIPDGKSIEFGSVTIDGTSSILVQAGGALYITKKNGVVAFNTSNLVIEAYEGNMGIFMMSPDVETNSNPAATVKLISKGYTKADGTPVFQRFGVPAAEGMVRGDIQYANATAWNYWNNGWQNCPKTMVIKPFVGLNITSVATAPGEVYTMPSNLLGNTDGQLAFTSEWNCFANSYTGEVDLKQLLTNLKADGEVNAAVWVYRAEDDWWDDIVLLDFDDDAAKQSALDPMQAFLFNLPGGNDYNFTIDYADNVWYPKFPKSGAPARKQAVNNITKAVINITSESGHTDRVTVRQDASFSNELDNGAELVKYMNENSFNIYATTEIGDMAQLATDDLNGQILTIATKDETKFKMTFSNTKGEQLAIRDNLTGSVINMVEGVEYFFSVAENSVSERFEIVGIHNAPTAVENVSAANNGAVYTIFGQYVGEKSDWNILPAGIYVVDGVKVVK